MTIKELQEKVLRIIRREDYVSITELKNWMSGDLVVRGDIWLKSAGNLIIYTDLSQNMADVLVPLFRDSKIIPHPATFFEEICTESPRNLPLGSWSMTEPYDTPHWLPTVMSYHL